MTARLHEVVRGLDLPLHPSDHDLRSALKWYLRDWSHYVTVTNYPRRKDTIRIQLDGHECLRGITTASVEQFDRTITDHQRRYVVVAQLHPIELIDPERYAFLLRARLGMWTKVQETLLASNINSHALSQVMNIPKSWIYEARKADQSRPDGAKPKWLLPNN